MEAPQKHRNFANRPMLARVLCLVALFFLLSQANRSWGQQPAYFMLGEEAFDGIQIYDVIQDLESNYWFATDEGIFKHNGYTFNTIACQDLNSVSAFGFVMNSKGTIFCHTLNHQILEISGDSCRVMYELQADERSADIHLAMSADDALVVVARRALHFDAQGKLTRDSLATVNYMGAPFITKQGAIISHLHNTDSLLVIEGNTFRYVRMSCPKGKPASVLRFSRIQGQVFAIDLAEKTPYIFDEASFRLLPVPVPVFLPVDEHLRYYNENDQLWVATASGGLYVLNSPNMQSKPELIFRNRFISNVYQDREGSLLLSTFNDGVIVVPDLGVPDVMPIPQEQSVAGIEVDEDLGLLIGSSKGQLMALKNGHFSILSDAGTKPLEVIHSLPGHPLILFDDGKVKALDKRNGHIHGVTVGSLKDVAWMDRNHLFLALNLGVQEVTWDGGNGFTATAPLELRIRSYAIGIDPQSRELYVATADGLKFMNAKGELQTVSFGGKRVFPTDLGYHDGIMYAATKAQGILLLESGRVTRQVLPKASGQVPALSHIAFDQGKLFGSSSLGFIGIGADGSIFAQLNKANGFSTNKIYDFVFDGGNLWILHSKGLQQLDRRRFAQRQSTPQIRIQAVTVNDSILPEIGKAGDFSSNQRKYRFELSSPTLRHRENIVYHYKLQGYETNWTTAPYADHIVTYNALGPGQYTFMVNAENRGAFSPTLTYSFSISQPLYSRWWFILLSGLLVLLLVTLVYRRQLVIQRRKAFILNELNLSRLTAIQSQMNPHFIFNALNSIQDLVLKGDIEHSYSYITTFSNLVRSTLKASEKDFIDFEEEVELLELYLSLEQLRFKRELIYEIDADDIDPDIQVPPLLIQPFVENALVHGLLHKSGAKHLKIRFARTDVLVCTITDDGIGRERARAIRERQRADHESFSGKALRNRFDILSDIFGGDFGYEYTDLVEDGQAIGTQVILRIPLKRQF